MASTWRGKPWLRIVVFSRGPDRTATPVTDEVEAISLREVAAELLARKSPVPVTPVRRGSPGVSLMLRAG